MVNNESTDNDNELRAEPQLPIGDPGRREAQPKLLALVPCCRCGHMRDLAEAYCHWCGACECGG